MMNHLQCSFQAQNHQDKMLDGPVAILWDIVSCPVPSGVPVENVAGNVRKALRMHPVLKGAVTMFSAYGDCHVFSKKLREGCQRTGVKLVDVPSCKKLATDKAILADMFLFALDNRPPASILLISGDADFSPALHMLGQREYTVIVVVPAICRVESALSNAGMFVWDWPTVARGEGFVPQSVVHHKCEPSGIHINRQLMGRKNGQNKEMPACGEIPGSKCHMPAKMEPVFLREFAHMPMEFEGAHLSSKCKTPKGLQSNPAEPSKFTGKRSGELSLPPQPLNAKKLKMKQNDYSAPAKVNTIFRYKCMPISNEFTHSSSAEFNDWKGILPKPTSEVPLVGQNGSHKHALLMQSQGVDKEPGKMKNKKNEFGTLASMNPTWQFGGIPHSLSECNNTQNLPAEASDVLLVEKGSPQVKLQVQSTSIDGIHAKNRMMDNEWCSDVSGIPHSLLENDNPQCPPSKPSVMPPVEHGAQVQLQVQSSNDYGIQIRKRRKKKKIMKQNEPASPAFSFRYIQIPVESNRTHYDCNSLQRAGEHKLQEPLPNINEELAGPDEKCQVL